MDLKQRLIDQYGRDFGTEAVLSKFDDFVDYLNRIIRPAVRRFLVIH
jgi:hypothetical protein